MVFPSTVWPNITIRIHTYYGLKLYDAAAHITQPPIQRTIFTESPYTVYLFLIFDIFLVDTTICKHSVCTLNTSFGFVVMDFPFSISHGRFVETKYVLSTQVNRNFNRIPFFFEIIYIYIYMELRSCERDVFIQCLLIHKKWIQYWTYASYVIFAPFRLSAIIHFHQFSHYERNVNNFNIQKCLYKLHFFVFEIVTVVWRGIIWVMFRRFFRKRISNFSFIMTIIYYAVWNLHYDISNDIFFQYRLYLTNDVYRVLMPKVKFWYYHLNKEKIKI